MPAVKPTEVLRIKLNTWTRQPISMISEHSAHSTPLTVYFHTICMYIYIHTCLFVFICMHRQEGSDIESKVDKMASSAECRIWTQGLWNPVSGRLDTRHWQADWAMEDQAKKLDLNSIALPHDEWSFIPLNPIADLASPPAMAIYVFVGVIFLCFGNMKEISNRKKHIEWSFRDVISNFKVSWMGYVTDAPSQKTL